MTFLRPQLGYSLFLYVAPFCAAGIGGNDLLPDLLRREPKIVDGNRPVLKRHWNAFATFPAREIGVEFRRS